MEKWAAFTSWVAASVAEKVMASRKEALFATLETQLLDDLAEYLYRHGVPQTNVTLEVGGARGLVDLLAAYTITPTFEFGAKSSTELLDILKMTLGDDEGQRFFDTEIEATQVVTLRPITELVFGRHEGKHFIPATPQEEAVAAKLIAFVQRGDATPLTEAERELLLIRQDQMKVKPGLLGRVAGYCKSADQLKALFRLMIPVSFLSRPKFGVSDTLQERHSRLMRAALDILGDVEEERTSTS
jgi:hypothetical protein